MTDASKSRSAGEIAQTVTEPLEAFPALREAITEDIVAAMREYADHPHAKEDCAGCAALYKSGWDDAAACWKRGQGRATSEKPQGFRQPGGTCPDCGHGWPHD